MRLFFRTRCRILVLGIVAVTLFGRGSPAGAQEPASLPASGPTPAATTPATSPASPRFLAIQARIAQLEQAKELDEKVRAKAIASYRQALTKLQEAQTWADRAERFRKAAQEAPEKLAALKSQVPLPTTVPTVEETSLAQLERLLTGAKASLADAVKKLDDAQTEPKRRAERRQEILKSQAAAKKKGDDANAELSAAAPSGEAPEITAARLVLLRAQKDSAAGELQTYLAELDRSDAEADLLVARKDAAAKTLQRQQGLVAAIQDAVNRRRTMDARQASENAQWESANAHPALKNLAGNVADLAKQRTGPQGLVARIEQASKEQQQVQKALSKVQAQYHDITERIRLTGMTDAMCSLMRKVLAEIPDRKLHEQRLLARQEEISSLQLRLLDVQEQREALADIDAQAARLTEDLTPPVEPDKLPEVRDAARRLLEAKRDNLDALIRDYNTYFNELVDLDSQERVLLGEARKLQTFIDERILWTPSSKPIRWDDFRAAGKAALYLASPTNWAGAAQNAWRKFRGSPMPFLAGLVAAIVCLIYRPRIISRLRRIGQGVRDHAADTFARTLEAFLWAIVLTVPLPGLILLASMLVDSPEGFGAGLSRGLTFLAATVAVLQFLRQVCRPMGLGEAHFDWPGESLRTARAALRFFMLVSGSMLLIVSLVGATGNEAWRGSLGRMASSVYFAAMAVFAYCLLRPRGPVVTNSPRTGLFYRFRYLWYVLGMAMPIFAGALSWAGFGLTAARLSQRLVYTFLLLALAMILQALLKRAMALGLRHAVARRAQTVPQTVPAATDTETSRRQVEHLLGLLSMVVTVLIVWWVWTPIFPALGMLQHVPLWGEGVSLADAGMAIIVLALTVVAGKNFPALVDVLLLPRMHLDAGGRYAVRAVLRYIIGFVGVVVALGLVGVAWSNVQWLVAAMTVGLGFGLQEIFANFVSGLIILFERPVRIGDTITIGDITGTVTRMQIRSTTITDSNCRELIVPNKDFITGRVINWTLSDRLIRLVLPVLLPPGMEPARGERILLEATGRNRLVLKNPPPSAVLSALADGLLRLELRVFIQGAENLPAGQTGLLQAQQDQVRNELNMAIEKALREATPTATA